MDRNTYFLGGYYNVAVALRKESVDRNFVSAFDVLAVSASLSARRAWIEMFLSMGLDGRFKRRSPQGERG